MKPILIITLSLLSVSSGFQLIENATVSDNSTTSISSATRSGYLSSLNVLNPLHWFSSSSPSPKKDTGRINSRSDENSNFTIAKKESNQTSLQTYQELNPSRDKYAKRILIIGPNSGTTTKPKIQTSTETTTIPPNQLVVDKANLNRTTTSIVDLFTTTPRPKATSENKRLKKILIKNKKGKIFERVDTIYETNESGITEANM